MNLGGPNSNCFVACLVMEGSTATVSNVIAPLQWQYGAYPVCELLVSTMFPRRCYGAPVSVLIGLPVWVAKHCRGLVADPSDGTTWAPVEWGKVVGMSAVVIGCECGIGGCMLGVARLWPGFQPGSRCPVWQGSDRVAKVISLRLAASFVSICARFCSIADSLVWDGFCPDDSGKRVSYEARYPQVGAYRWGPTVMEVFALGLWRAAGFWR